MNACTTTKADLLSNEAHMCLVTAPAQSGALTFWHVLQQKRATRVRSKQTTEALKYLPSFRWWLLQTLGLAGFYTAVVAAAPHHTPPLFLTSAGMERQVIARAVSRRVAPYFCRTYLQ
jgi:hypothetical protein